MRYALHTGRLNAPAARNISMASQDSRDRLFRLPALEELLADDVTRAVMQADHVGALEVRGLCNAVGIMLEQRCSVRKQARFS